MSDQLASSIRQENLFSHSITLPGVSMPERLAAMASEARVVLSQMQWAAHTLVTIADQLKESTGRQSLLELHCALTNWFVERRVIPESRLPIFLELEAKARISPRNAEKVHSSLLSFFKIIAQRYIHGTIDRDLKSILYRIQKLPAETTERDVSLELLFEIFATLIPGLKIEIAQLADLLNSTTSSAITYRPIEPICHLEAAESYRCVVCHPLSLHGFHIEPKLRADGSAHDVIIFPPRTEGYNGLVHGGFLMMLLDEILVYSLVLKHGKVGLTTKLETKFLAPVRVGQKYDLTARIDSFDGKSGRLTGEISKDGKICAQAMGEFIVPGLKIGERIFGASVINEPYIGKMFLRDET